MTKRRESPELDALDAIEVAARRIKALETDLGEALCLRKPQRTVSETTWPLRGSGACGAGRLGAPTPESQMG